MIPAHHTPDPAKAASAALAVELEILRVAAEEGRELPTEKAILAFRDYLAAVKRLVKENERSARMLPPRGNDGALLRLSDHSPAYTVVRDGAVTSLYLGSRHISIRNAEGLRVAVGAAVTEDDIARSILREEGYDYLDPRAVSGLAASIHPLLKAGQPVTRTAVGEWRKNFTR